MLYSLTEKLSFEENPKIQIKVCPSTPKELLLKALDMIRRGKNSIEKDKKKKIFNQFDQSPQNSHLHSKTQIY